MPGAGSEGHAYFRADSANFSSFESQSQYHYESLIAKSGSDKELQYFLPPDPAQWGSDVSRNSRFDAEDALHDPDRVERRLSAQLLSVRAWTNLGCLLLVIFGILALFIGFPVITFFMRPEMSRLGGFNLGGINATGQVPTMPGNYALIDKDTPKDVYQKPSWLDPSVEMQLVFSDEFNTEGRTFYPGDDPYWEAVDLHYWGTGNLEWYDPIAITTNGGALQITLSQTPSHGLNYQGGMIASWNKFCFTGGLIEASVTLPGANNVAGLWPAIWTLGNLGRAGYGATLEGLWPYSYDTCDVGTLPNQTLNGLPLAATNSGPQGSPYNGALSFQAGQRLSRCTCAGESHPGPVHKDGSFVGRAAPEIDIFEAQMHTAPDGTYGGAVSQSAQWAPFNHEFVWDNSSANFQITDPTVSALNSYLGSPLQQASSVVSTTDQGCYQDSTGCLSVYGFEYKPGFDAGYISWINNNQLAWTLRSAGMGPDPLVEISDRPIPEEPMYIIMNLGMSESFGHVDLANLVFPAIMSVDYVRVYQPMNAVNIGCDPPGAPTAEYIATYMEAYTNPNYTTWVDDFKQPMPKNRLVDTC